MEIINGKRTFDLDDMLSKPLFAHLSTVEVDMPKDSPVWFHWENNEIWIIGTKTDTFPKRIQKNSKCAIGIVDFDSLTGKVLHAGFRGKGSLENFDSEIVYKIISKYLGQDEQDWDPRFQNLDDSNVLIRFTPDTVVIRDQSYIIKK
ncbi:pyridoxamine 5'-phosphate oxidase family protein [Sutcliffiella rhizosphaerae]|uniref:Pyridoxamine 5'-phosphate oxidase family protein n=1 Tax=Sutcliffiella rhizosphaerae TaxID=2880967 RepID=A0ABM8YQZ4_9BACI|nr:pyridoxamine 5'-phosphate oxidase family protein [Sutcliffiella rhizosphaerae]CAG9622390.1 hypothetical protein BACCIP111883_03181 [Sutcliffiella rhizosphaerae]